MESIIAHNRTAVVLNANQEQHISFGTNIDATEARVYLRYPPLKNDSRLEIFFSDTDGRKAGNGHVILSNSGTSEFTLEFSDEQYVGMKSYIFNGIAFKCPHNFTFEFWIERQPL